MRSPRALVAAAVAAVLGRPGAPPPAPLVEHPGSLTVAPIPPPPPRKKKKRKK